MDVERTIQFILKTEAQTDIRLAGITKLGRNGMRMLAKHDASIVKLTKAQQRTEASIAELSRLVADLARTQRRTEMKMAQLADAQKATEQTLKAFISNLGRRNGRNNHRI